MFLHLSVSHSVHRGVCIPACIWAETPLQADTLRQTPPVRHPLGRNYPGRHLSGHCMLGYTHPLPSACWETSPLGGHCCGRYVFYWNAFLYNNMLICTVHASKCSISIVNRKCIKLRHIGFIIRVRSIAEKNKTINPHSMLESFVNRMDARR